MENVMNQTEGVFIPTWAEFNSLRQQVTNLENANAELLQQLQNILLIGRLLQNFADSLNTPQQMPIFTHQEPTVVRDRPIAQPSKQPEQDPNYVAGMDKNGINVGGVV